MHCFECNVAGVERAAVAVCSRCGATSCADHTHELRTQMWSQTMGNPTMHTIRRLCCSECVRLDGQPHARRRHDEVPAQP
ncbi:hypothetical protein Xcel_3431 (plasmid) [Xylanimonas cellulosilytica DSM 15894]|uniref:DUF2180 family protein n=1 Tax=Xylanimonas cellulosilytica (strain DSM 15894 / JCM 12276 / CECT 5975 / KCTC 9989 / LMG 20990 / NBRC 107835 / XIL07) TaxID=446471 RepID=D1C0W4_XYLCX|nr:hypothetical protein Xcel_3431 [Xylanimonas cellulosilytica DSM 15894]